MTSVPAIGFEYRPSRVLERVLAGTTALSTAAIWLSALPWWGCLAASVALGGALAWEVRRWRRAAVSGAVWLSDGSWRFRSTSLEEAAATLCSARVLAGCLWLRLATASQGPVFLLLAPDNSDVDLRRRLCVRLSAVRADERAARP